MKKLKIRIQCKCQSCGKIWMDSRQWVYCMLCQIRRNDGRQVYVHNETDDCNTR